MNQLLVIGAGQAGAQLAMSLRQAGYAPSIRLIGDEPYLPYQRPPLSKKFLAEYRDPDALFLRTENFWRTNDVNFELGTAVDAVDVQGRRVTLADGREIAFDTLVFATGTSARTLPVPGIELCGVYSVRRIDDVVRLRPPMRRRA